MYTSGSTGLPKGVAIAHSNTVNFLTWAQRTFNPEELAHTLFATSLNFDLAVYECFAPLVSGGTVHLVPDALSLVTTEQPVSLINTVPSAIAHLIEANAVPVTTRTVNLAGEALKPHVVEHLFAHASIQNVCNLYGPSETTTYSTWIRMNRTEGFVSHIGRPIANTQIYILNPHGQPVPLGVAGEIHIAGAGVARGYLNRPELTAERFLTDPFSADPDARMYKTGDLGRWHPDGNIEYLGRNDFQVKLRGFRIELGEIEAQLMQCRGVREAVVLAREDEPGQKRLIAYLRPLDGVELVPAELRQQLARHLAEYMLPSAFMTLDAFPLTPNGKLDRQALPAPDLSAVVARGYEAPIGEVETALAQIWQNLLGLERVGRHDHFFELGGHSLMIVGLIEQLYDFGWRLDVRSVFAAPVLTEMAQAIQSDASAFVVPPNRIPEGCTVLTPDMLSLVSLSQAEIEAIVEATPGGASNVQDIYPLAPLQEGILFHHLLQAQGDTYLLQSLIAFNTREHLDTFLSALQQVIDRHDILRTAACWQGLAQPVQVVWRQAPLCVNHFTPATADDIPAQLLAHTDPRRHRLDLSRAPLFTADIAHDPAQDEWLLALRFHHLVSDHMTLELIFAEIAQIQQGHAESLPAALPYRNFIAQTLSVPATVHEAYFRDQLADVDAPTAPFGVLTLPGNDEPIAEAHLPLAPALAEAIHAQARRLGVSPGVLFHVAWAQVLAQTSGRDDVVFGSVLLGRLQGVAGAARILGMFINTLPVRVSLAGRSVQEVVQATYRSLTTLLEHEQAPLALAQRCSSVAQPMPLFSTLLNYRHSQTSEANAVETTRAGMRIVATEERTNYPLTLSVDDLGTGFRLTAQTVAGIDPTRVTAYLATAISGLVDALAHNPQRLIRNVPILPPTERQQLLVEFNATQSDFPQDALIHQLFEAQAAHHPDATAVVFEGQSLSYHELNHRANRLAHHLIALGVRPDDRVAICVERSLELLIGLLGILKAGGAYVPLDPAYPAERLAYMLNDAAPVALLTQTTQVDKLIHHIPTVVLDAQESAIAAQSTHNPDAQALGLTSRHLAYVIYTSGSTGLPKGVMVEHRSINRLVINNPYADIGSDDCVAHCANIAFDASTWEIWSALLNGGCLHVVSPSALLDPVRFRDSLVKGQVTALWLTAGLFNEYLGDLEPLFGQLRYLLIGGDVLDPRKIQRAQLAEFQPAHLINGYGPTETTTFATTYTMTSPVDVTRPIPIGCPIANTQIYLLDPYGQPVPLGVAGEIYIAGAGVARGYLNRPELTAERFLADPFSSDPDARMYKTGDLGYWRPDGNLEYLGRNDLQVKLRGFRIELGEIEARLVQCHGVREAVVVAREDEPGHKRLVAYLLPQVGVELVPAELRQQLAQHFAEYMQPSAFMTLDAFPLTPNGKLDRQALPAPDLSAIVTRSYEAPVGEIEIALAQIWQDLLKLEQVGRHDHFFELGGHSLLAVQLAARVRQQLARKLSLPQLFAQPLLTDLAKTLADASAIAQVVIPAADRSQPLTLSFAQQRLWFLGQLDPAASLAYHIPMALRLTGKLDRHLLTRALDRLVARHESLRTRFVLIEGQPCQHIDPADIGFTLSCQDLRPLDLTVRANRVAELTALETQTPFDFVRGPLIRGQLLQLTDEEHILLLTQHHIIADGWSIGVLMHELDALYRAALDGHDDPLPPLSLQYADYAVWQRDWLQGAVLTEQRDFWYSQLQGAPALLALPTDRPRPSVQTYAGNRIPIQLDTALLASLKKLGQRHNTTLFMTMLAAWSIVLTRLSGQDDIVIGTPVANRPHTELENLIGFFVNTLALRVTPGEVPRVADLLAQVRERALAAYAHQDLPFEQVVEALQPERSLSYSPVFQVMLALNNTPPQNLALPGLQLAPVEQVRHSAHFDLTLSLTETEAGLVGDLEYSTDLFDSATIERIVGYLENVLTAMAADATQTVAGLPMLPASERQLLLTDFNATQADFPQDALIHQLFEAQAAHSPDATAVVFEDQSLSYHELNHRANRLAHHLITLGVRPDDRVAICVERSPEQVIGLLAILKAGGAYVPLDPTYPAERLAYMLDDAAPVALLTQTAQVDTLVSPVPTVMLDALAPSLATQPTHNPDAQALGLTSRHLAYVIYTSGSTGQPKGVMVEHRGLSNLIATQQDTLAINPSSRILQFASNSFDAGIWECCMALLAGASLHLAQRTHLLPGTALLETLEAHAITHVLLSPTALAALDAVPVTLQTLIVGGEACPPSLVKRWATGRRMVNAYGPTESTVCAAIYLCDNQEEGAPPIGRPIANTRIYILDPYGQPVPLGVAGEIYIAGAGVARGYLNRPELTAERFPADPFSSDPDARMYKTGDLGRWRSDGNLEYLGRNDFQVKLRGFRIELGEIETQLMQCDGVREAVVLAREDDPGHPRLVAYMQPQAGAELVPAELRQQLAQHLAEYMLPSAFMTLDAFPLTPNGKLDRQALPAPDASAVVTRGYEAPVGEAETILAQIWQDLLGLERVGRHDHFFELGGHSLMIVSLIERLRGFGRRLEVRSVFSAPVLTEIAQSIQDNTDAFAVPPNRIPENCTALTPDMLSLISLSQAEIDAIVGATPGGASNVQDIYPLAPLQEGILFHHLLQAQGDTYLLQSLIAFNTREHLDTFLSALQQVIDRHDILRTAACWQGLAQPVQVVWRQAPLCVNHFTPATADDVPAQLLTHTDPCKHRLDLSRAPLFAADIAHDPAQDEWLLALRFHHLVSDHMTLELIFAEIAQVQQGHAESLPAALPYRNFIAQTLSVPAATHEAYFRTQLADVDTPTAPFGVLTMSGDNESIAEARLPLPLALAEAIRAQARRLRVSPGVLFHVAWAQVLAQTSGHDDVVFGSVLLGRLQGVAGADQILGMFINTLPVRVSLAGRSVQEVVQATYRNLTTLLEHEQAPLALAQRCSGVAQSLPLFSTLLNYRHSQTSGADAVDIPQTGMHIVATGERTNYPLTLSVDDLGTDFHLTTLTVAGIDPARVTAYLVTAISGLVDALVRDPQRLIRDVPILPPQERQQLLVEFNATQTDFPQDALIHQLFEAQAAHRPDAIAVVFEGQSLSYHELNRRANRLAHHLIALGVRPDDRVAICVERSLDLVVGLLGILKAGGAYVPLDPAYPAERLAYMLDDAAPVALLTQTALTDTLVSAIPTIVLDSSEPLLMTQPAHNPDAQSLGLTSRHLAYIIYTSGSTGLPKGVMVEHRSINRLVINNPYADIGSDDCVAHCANIAFDASTWEIWSALLNGGRLHVVAPSALLDPVRFRDSLVKGQVTALWLTAGLFNEYLGDLEPLFGQLRYLLIGGDVLDPRKIQRAQLAECQPAHLINGYGPTETTTFAATYTMTSPVDVTRPIPIGRPIANTQIYLLDPQGQPVPLGVAGEIYIAGAGVARGYLNRPELTAERFLADPFSSDPDARMYKTGDLGYWRPDGNLEYLGRNDFQVKLRGFRIELGEIEARLMQCPGVREAVVLAREDESGHKRLIAYLLPQTGIELVPAELRQQLAQHLAEYMLPSAFMVLDSFPLTPNGKLDRQALPAPDASAVVTRGYEAPLGEIEIALAQIWQDLLRLEQIGRHDHFFELGGHSLLAVQLVARVRQDLARELPLQQLFDLPLLADLAQALSGALATAQIVIPAADRSRLLPLSFAQQRLWFLGQLDPAASLAYHIPVALRLTGQLDRHALITALDRLVARHESLRTRFVLVEGQPCQHIDPADIGFALSCQDLRLLEPAAHTNRITDLAAREAQAPFDFIQGPLIRGQLLQLTDEAHMLLLTQHHIIADGWSIGVLVHELGTLYRAALDGHSDPLPPLSLQYADYAIWQRNWLQATALTEQRDFWCAQLQNAPALLVLPTDRPRPPVQTYAGGRVSFQLDTALLASLKGLGQRHNTTLFMTVLSAWSIVLARLSGQDDIVIGTPVANRPHPELENLIGFFVNTLALRVTPGDAPRVADLLAQVRERALAAYTHQDLPFEQVVEALQPDRSLSYSPVFQVMLVLNNMPAENLVLPDLQLSWVEQAHHSAHFDLTLSLTETEAGLAGDLVYAADLFDPATVERMVSYLENVLTAMVADATQTVAGLPMLSASERQLLLTDFNATQADFPQDVLIHQLFEAQAAHNPDATAIICGEQALSYDELNRRANRLAHHLLAQGVHPDDRVAICLERSPEMVVGLLAILKAGGAYVPLDPAYPAERLAYMLDDAAPVVLLTQTAWINTLASLIPTIVLDTQDASLMAQPDHNPDTQALGLTSRHLAYVIYTSGSTGLPKGVAITHRNTVNFLTWAQRTFSPEELAHTLFATSLNFDLAVYECFTPLLSGGTVHLVPNVLSLLTTEQSVSLINTVPSAIAHLIESDAIPMTTRTVNLAGEALKPHVIEHLFARESIQNVCNLYGPSETTTYSTWVRMSRAEGFVSHIGRPIANTQIYILDSLGHPVPLGVTGEIHIAGAGVARGYLNRPELTAEHFLADPFSADPDARMYKTGDLGRWRSDGNIDYLGRNDFQVKLRGFRIELGEIEVQLMQCRGVREAVVLAREDEPGQKRLVAYLRPLDGVELVPAELRQQLAQRLAEYMLPSAFMTLDAFPLTPNGKLDRQALPAPDASAVVARGYETPVGEAEAILAQIWQDLLGLERVGRYDHFFELGGHSLMIVSLIERLRGCGWLLEVRSVFAAPVLAEMAQSIQDDASAFVVPPNRIPEDCTALTPDMLTLLSLSQTEIEAIVKATPGGASNVQDIYPLAPLQEGILFHHLLQTQGDTYLLQSLLAFDSRKHLDTFLAALQQVIDRHDILRTAACWQGLAQPVQVVWRQAPLCINSFIPATADDIPAQLLAHTDPRRHRLDLSRAPLFAADIAHDPAQDEWLLALRFHHLVSDHMTLALIFTEIAQIQQGNAETLPAALPYRNFIAQTLSVPAATHEAYFRDQLADVNAPTAPFGVLTLPGNDEPITEAQLPLAPALAEAIRAAARRLGVSPGVLFHVAWAQVLAQTSGHDDVVFGSVLLGRLQGGAGADRILGMFINTLPVRVSLAGRSVQEVVQDTYRSLTALLEHEQAPLALAQRCSGMAQSIPLFSALLNYRHSQTSEPDAVNTTWAGMRIVATGERTNYPLTLSVDDLGTGFHLTAQAVTGIDPTRVTAYLVTAISGLVDALIRDPQQLIQNVPILPPTERQQLLVDFNATQADFPQDALIHQLFEVQAARHPDAIAVVFEGQSLSYHELNRRANRLAHHLITLGVHPDDRVAICVERSLELVVGLLGILKAGGAYVPLDPTYPAERLAYMLDDAAPVALLTQTTQVDKLTHHIPTVILDGQEPAMAIQPSHNPDAQALGLTSRHLAYVIYTSGSTGLPKGVMVEHRNVLRLIINNGFADIGPDDCIAHCANVSFDAATWEVWTGLVHGARILLIPEKTLLQPDYFGQRLALEGVSALFLTTALFNQYASLIASSLSGLRYVLFGGEQIDIRPAIHLRADYPPQHLLHVYGPTETTTFATAYEIPFTDSKCKTIPIGHPIANTQIYILDTQGQPVPLGVTGEIHIAGAGVARGYLNRPELTAERFLTDPFSSDPDARMYKTGDLGYWRPDGNLEYLGRNDLQVKLRGFRIELGEIEARLVQCHGVREAVVLAREDEPGHKRLVAYLLPQVGVELVPAELRQQLAQHLAEYMLPNAFMTLDAFPLTPNGKIDRPAFPVPDQSAIVMRGYADPIGETEIALAQIWQDLLGLEQVGRHDHFFELGGHSLLAVQLVARVRQDLARELPLQQLFDQPILIDLAQTLSGAATTAQVVIPAADRSQPLPLSFAQQRLWFLGQLDPAASLAYHIPVALRLTGQLDRHALTTALERLIARHESLRTCFVLVDSQPCQHIAPTDIGFALPYQDLRPLEPAAHTNRIAELASLEAQTLFDFAQGPLIRGQLLQLTDEAHLLLLTLHHIITDGWSIGVLMHELDTLYRAALDGHGDPLPPLPIQYADYAVWQRDWLQGAALTEQRDFWYAQLQDAPALLTLPTDRPRPSVQTYAGGRISFQLDTALLASLKGLGQRHHTTLFMIVLAAWNIVLARLSGQDDIVIGTPVANRPHRELENLIGFFVNTLALRVTLSDTTSIAGLLAQVRERALAAYAHQDLPFEQVVEALQPERNLSYSPIFQVMLALNNTPAQNLTLPGLQLASIEQIHHSAHFDLTLSLTETESGLAGDLEYAADLFDSATVERIVGYLENVLTAMAADATQTIAALPMLSAPERQQLLVDFNTTQTDFPQDALIHQLFEAQAAQHPDAIAVVFEDQVLSYDELNRRANRLAHHLIALGVRPDDRVAICLERSLELVVGLLAILKAGGAYVPLDPAYPTERLAYMLNDAAPVVLLTQAAQVGTLASTVPTVVLDTQDPSLMAQPPHNPDTQALGLTSHHLAYVIYTSGSTGLPKGVMVEHRNVLRLIINNGFADIGPDDCIAHCANIAFDASTWEIWSALLNGGRLHVVSPSVLLDPVRFCDSLVKGQVTALWLTAGLFNEYLSDLKPLFGQLRYLLIGGDVLDPRKIRRAQLAGSQPTHLINGYGPTETTTFAATYAIASPVDVTRSIPIGRPIANTQIYILDPQGQPVPLGVAGEIHIAGAGVARGYLNRPELTAERFPADPFSADPDARMYRTGDLGRWHPDGNIDYLGRNDFQVKLRGFRIELGEIEARLTQCCGVREAVVLAREDEPGQKRLIAYLRPQVGVELVPAELRQQLAQHLAEYMLPSAFMTLDTFPLTPNGKLDRQALPAPDSSAVIARGYEAPVGEAETSLAQIWQDLLGLEQVGRYDHFFELGGHSLMIVSLIERLRDLDWRLDVRSVFAAPVLAEMAQAVQGDADTFVVPPNRIPAGCTALTPDMLPLISLSQAEIESIVGTIPGGASNVQDIYPLAPLQEGILFHHLLQAQGDTYLLQSLIAFDTRERLDTFLAALQQVIDRHDILRTAACWQDLTQPVQVVWRQAPLGINLFTPATADDVPAQLRAHTDPHLHRLNLSRAPLFAADIAHDPAQNEWLLALRFHHLVSDHMTLELIFAEIAQIQQGHTDTLPAALPYRNFIAQTLNVPVTSHEAYFRTQLADVDAPTAPFGVLTMPSDSQPVAEARLPLAPALAETIRVQARRLGVSPSVLFHVAWAQVLAQTSGRDDVVFGSVLLGRLQGVAGADRILGMFINTLPMRVSLADCSVQEVVQATYRSLTTLLEHEQAPLALAQRSSGVAQPMPLFSALLNYRHSQIDKADAIDTTWAGMRIVAIEERTNYPLTLSVDDLGVGFHLTAQTVAGIDPARVTAYLATAINGLVDALIRDPQRLILQVPILPASEQQQIVVDFNATQADFPQDALIHQLFEAQAAHNPAATAVVCGEQALSYGELNRRANRLAHHLIALGVRPDDRVAICVERSPEMVVGLLGILKAGGAYVPLDPAYPTERLAYMLNDAAPVALLTQMAWIDTLASPVPTVVLDAQEPALAAQLADNPESQTLGLTSRHLAYVIYTSGSTGLPKGVAIAHCNTVNFLTWAQRTFSPEELAHTLFATSLNFDLAVYECFAPLVSGGTVHLIPDALSLITTEQPVSLINTVPSAIAHLIEAKAVPITARTVNLAGEALKPHVVEHLFAHSSVQDVCNLYGPSETTTYSTWIRMNRAEGFVSHIGRPIANTQIYILDSLGQPVPLGVAGEIHIAGAGVARGYLNRPELTAERFLADPFSPTSGGRMYKTGDLGRWRPDGNIDYLGRNDFQIKLRGFRIELGEIETQLMQCHGVREAIVLTREDEPGHKRLIAYVRPQDGVELVPAELRQQLAQHLAEYMLPSAFMTLESFPLTPNGKLDRQAFPAPDSSAVVARGYESPQGRIETALAQIWQDLLELVRIGRHDHFFELGGHSLMVVQLITRIKAKFLVDIPLTSLFLSPKLAEQANIIFSAQMNAVGENDIESIQNSLDLMSTEELLAMLDGDNNRGDNNQ
ncbi:non-ribosomal peptide synthase/polyketide synthase [Xenorhabdus aichiensis]|uniref:non-ribosomal peptide synthase/polyketide synthase n=1 Tax=Xenorhabdus aichiensis TaxID=3025874 RepID=UPI003F9C1110